MAVCFEEWANFLARSADGHGGDAEQLAQEVHGGEFAQVEHGDQDPVGWDELGFGTCARCDQTLVTTTCAEHLLALSLQPGVSASMSSLSRWRVIPVSSGSCSERRVR